MAFRIDGCDYENNYHVVASKTNAKMKKKLECGQMVWSLKNKSGNVGGVAFSNAYLDAWDAAHGRGSYGDVSTSTWKRLIKTYSNGKTSYARVKKWSRAKAKKKGKKAIRSYVAKRIVPGISLR